MCEHILTSKLRERNSNHREERNRSSNNERALASSISSATRCWRRGCRGVGSGSNRWWSGGNRTHQIGFIALGLRARAPRVAGDVAKITIVVVAVGKVHGVVVVWRAVVDLFDKVSIGNRRRVATVDEHSVATNGNGIGVLRCTPVHYQIIGIGNRCVGQRLDDVAVLSEVVGDNSIVGSNVTGAPFVACDETLATRTAGALKCGDGNVVVPVVCDVGGVPIL